MRPRSLCCTTLPLPLRSLAPEAFSPALDLPAGTTRPTSCTRGTWTTRASSRTTTSTSVPSSTAARASACGCRCCCGANHHRHPPPTHLTAQQTSACRRRSQAVNDKLATTAWDKLMGPAICAEGGAVPDQLCTDKGREWDLVGFALRLLAERCAARWQYSGTQAPRLKLVSSRFP